MEDFTTWRKRAFATENFPWGSFREQKERLLIVGRGTRTQALDLYAAPRQYPVLLAMIFLGLLAILGDTYTTLLMADSEAFMEGNLVAARLQEFLGLPGYVIAATLVSYCVLPLLLVRGGNVIAWLLVGGGATFLLFKAYVAYSNFHLLYTVIYAG